MQQDEPLDHVQEDAMEPSTTHRAARSSVAPDQVRNALQQAFGAIVAEPLPAAFDDLLEKLR